MQREAKPLLIISNFCTTIKSPLLLSTGMSKQSEMSERISIFKVACLVPSRLVPTATGPHARGNHSMGRVTWVMVIAVPPKKTPQKSSHIFIFFSFIFHPLRILREETDFLFFKKGAVAGSGSNFFSPIQFLMKYMKKRQKIYRFPS